jgi:apolipoprotein N-acyltransferase
MLAASLAAAGGLLLALAFPRAGVAVLAPVGAAALFLAWHRASWKRSFALGWFAGLIFFTISFWWWSTSIKTEVGALAYVAVVIAAAIEALSIGAAGVLAALVTRRAPAALAPLGAAAAFTIAEWTRSIGQLGVPFAQLGYTQAETPLRAIAAYAGTIGLTFVICILGAYGADAIARRVWRPFAAAGALVVVTAVAAWGAWPARTVAAPTIPVVAVQGNIAQSLKWQPNMLESTVERYTAMTRSAIATDPKLVVWPETVIAINGGGLNQYPELLARFAQLARSGDATLVAGSVEIRGVSSYNTLYFFTPAGLTATYEKRQLVPFAEHFPGQAFLSWLPYVGQLNGNFAEGSANGVTPTSAGITVGSLICWESAFGDIAFQEVRDGAQALVIATDDAWFGTSSGPYQHAQIAQLRAIESGEYVVRAAATGISGIIAPDGSWTSRAPLEVQENVFGKIGLPAGSAFAHIGPMRVFFAIIALYLALVLVPWRERA